jgi:hypothetical protein
MATYAQYQSFSLIAYNALKLQTSNVNSQIAKGCKDNGCTETLYYAKNLIDTVFAYGTECISVLDLTEKQIISVCNKITEILNFTTTPIPQLPETVLNTVGGNDFNSQDFNPQDFN